MTGCIGTGFVGNGVGALAGLIIGVLYLTPAVRTCLLDTGLALRFQHQHHMFIL